MSLRIRLQTSDQQVFDALRYLECDPEIPGRTASELTISVEPSRGTYRILEEGNLVREETTPLAVMEALHDRLFEFSLQDYPASPLIHAASLRKDGRRLLFVGEKGTGKTSLTLRLIREGYEIEGDENVFVTQEGVIARPRSLRVKDSAVEFMPELAGVLAGAPYYDDGMGLRIFNIDPRRAGAPFWRIEQGKVDTVIVLRPNHGGSSSIEPLPPLALARDVIVETGLRETGRGNAIGILTSVLGGARGFDLALGDHDTALACIEDVFQ